MLSNDSVLDRVAALLAYPGDDYFGRLETAQQALDRQFPPAARLLGEFRAAVGSFTTEEMEELFTRTFDLNPVCVLEVGWQLYGDEYKRGEFLVKMQQSLAQHGSPSSNELPDHLTRMLPLLDHLPPEEAEVLAREYVVPAVGKMLAGIEGKQNPFEHVLKAVSEVLETQGARVPQEVSFD